MLHLHIIIFQENSSRVNYYTEKIYDRIDIRFSSINIATWITYQTVVLHFKVNEFRAVISVSHFLVNIIKYCCWRAAGHQLIMIYEKLLVEKETTRWTSPSELIKFIKQVMKWSKRFNPPSSKLTCRTKLYSVAFRTIIHSCAITSIYTIAVYEVKSFVWKNTNTERNQ